LKARIGILIPRKSRKNSRNNIKRLSQWLLNCYDKEHDERQRVFSLSTMARGGMQAVNEPELDGIMNQQYTVSDFKFL
jgi:RNase P protein component